MGYACPVCDEPQQDAEHLANHLAFQAMTHGDDHESWLDEHAPDWAAGGPADLAPQVAEHATETEYEVVFDDTTEPDATAGFDPDLQGVAGHDGHAHDHEHAHGRRGGVDVSNVGPDTREVVEEARELTREMLSDEGEDDEDGEADS